MVAARVSGGSGGEGSKRRTGAMKGSGSSSKMKGSKIKKGIFIDGGLGKKRPQRASTAGPLRMGHR